MWIGTLGGLNVLAFDTPPRVRLGAQPSRRVVRVFGRLGTLASLDVGTVYACRVMPLLVDEGGAETVESIWVSGTGGLACHVAGRWFRFASAAGLPGSGATNTAMDPEGRLWVCTNDSGVLRSDQPVTLRSLEGLPNTGGDKLGTEVVEPIFAACWCLATEDVPLLYFKGAKFRQAGCSGGRMWRYLRRGALSTPMRDYDHIRPQIHPLCSHFAPSTYGKGTTQSRSANSGAFQHPHYVIVPTHGCTCVAGPFQVSVAVADSERSGDLPIGSVQ